MIEIMVVISIMSILALLMITLWTNARSAADQVGCQSNLRVLYNGAMLYVTERNGTMPDLTYWRLDEERFQRFSLIPYLYGNVPAGSLDMKNSVFSCPVVQKDADFRTVYGLDRMHATYGINLHMHGTNESGGSVSNYERWITRNPVAWNLANVVRPEQAPFFMDGCVMRSGNNVYYSVYQSFARIGVVAEDKPTGTWTSPFLHSGKRINVVFVDGRVDALTREQMLDSNWSGR